MATIERTGSRLIMRWRVSYHREEGMGTETLHLTRIGAWLSRWLWADIRED